jgi:hypothetical protein
MNDENVQEERAMAAPSFVFRVAQTSKSAVPQVSKPAGPRAVEQTWKSAARTAPNAFGGALHNIGRLALNLEWDGFDSWLDTGLTPVGLALTKSKLLKASQT